MYIFYAHTQTQTHTKAEVYMGAWSLCKRYMRCIPGKGIIKQQGKVSGRLAVKMLSALRNMSAP